MKPDSLVALLDDAYLSTAAANNAYHFTDRLHIWKERLKVNWPELSYIQAGLNACQNFPYYVPQDGRLFYDERFCSDQESCDALSLTPDDAFEAIDRAGKRSDLNAFISVADSDAITQQVDYLSQIGKTTKENLPALLGLPVAVKDLMHIVGFDQTDGSGLKRPKPLQDATVVSRLRRAGCIIVGTTNLHELACGITSNNPHYGAVVNPVAPSALPGGSSGGSAAAVKAGIIPVAIGTDTGGSIRIPAGCCGVVGFKPSFNAVPRAGLTTLGSSLDHVGPLARDVDLAARTFCILAGITHKTTKRLPNLKGVTFGIPDCYFYDPISDEVADAMDHLKCIISRDGGKIRDIHTPYADSSPAIQFVTLATEATTSHWDRLLNHGYSLGEDVRSRLEIGQFIPAIWYACAQRLRSRLYFSFQQAMADVDILLAPTLRTTAPPCNSSHVVMNGTSYPMHTAMTQLTCPFDLTGLPALSLPCGSSSTGLPICTQVVGKYGHDFSVLAISKQLESLLPRI